MKNFFRATRHFVKWYLITLAGSLLFLMVVLLAFGAGIGGAIFFTVLAVGPLSVGVFWMVLEIFHLEVDPDSGVRAGTQFLEDSRRQGPRPPSRS